MTYKIVVDSCCDLTPEKKADPHFQIVPLVLEIDKVHYIDDDSFDQAMYIKAMADSPECAHTACPSPDAYEKAYEGDEEMVFVVTLSQHLSGSYNSALVGKQIYEEEHPESPKRIHVFSSDSACVGETLVAFKIQELAEAGLGFGEIVEKTQDFLWNMKTYFCLEDMDTLKKNGRLSGIAALLVNALNIKPVCAGNHGVIVRVTQARGMEKALRSMVDHALKDVSGTEDKILAITHVNCPERAAKVRDRVLEKKQFKGVYIVNAAGVSTTYAGDQGIVLCF